MPRPFLILVVLLKSIKPNSLNLNIIEDVVYYATETTLYTTPTVNINAQPQWTVGQGEKITGIKFTVGLVVTETMKASEAAETLIKCPGDLKIG